MAARRDYYEVLEVTREADDEVVKKAYRRLAMKYHPDRNGGDKEAEVKFREVCEAYEVLRDPDKRARYDRYGHAGVDDTLGPGRGGADPFRSFFDEFFSIFRGNGPSVPELEEELEIDLVEAAKGGRRRVTVHRAEFCPECRGNRARPGTKPTVCP